MDEVVSTVVSGARSGIELTAEVLKLIVPAIAKGGVKLLGAGGKLIGYGITKAAEARNEKQAVGVVSRQQLLEQAAKASSDVKFTDNFPAEVIDSLAERAKAYQIPVTINGEGANRSISYLERDKDILAQIMQDWQTEQLTPKEIGGVSRITSFTVGENQIEAMKAEFRSGGVDCWFTQRDNGEIRCNFKTENAEQAKIITENFRKMQNEVAENFTAAPKITETERMKEISARIDELKNADSTARSVTYDRVLSDMRENGANFPEYSEDNTFAIQQEMPSAKQVAGREFWESQGYEINEDARGVEIVVPELDSDGNPVFDENGELSFALDTVYDISETNAYEKSIGAELENLQNEYISERDNAFNMSEQKNIVLSDAQSGRSVEIALTDDMRKEDITAILREDFGYTPARADLAANKFAAEIGADRKFLEPRAEDNLEKLQVNIRYLSDDALLARLSFSALKFKDGERAHLSVSHGDETVLLSPADLSDTELKTVFTERLGLSEQQAEKAVIKARKIDGQITGKHLEASFDKEQKYISIDKSSHNSFVLTSKDVTKAYDFTQINLEKRISDDFGIPLENAKNIVQKAKSQSLVQNRINSYNESIRKAKKAKLDPFKQKSSEKKVKR